VNDPSRDLIEAAQRGDGGAIVALVDQTQRFVYSVAMSIVRDPAEADDATQETFIKLLRTVGSYRFETQFTTWLYRVTANVCFDSLRRSKRRPTVPIESPDGVDIEIPTIATWGDPVRESEQRETEDDVHAAIGTLPVAQRLALTMHYFDDLAYDEIASILDLPLNTVKSHVRRGKERLATRLVELGHVPEVERCAAMM
jgi:RNA polymerase sigma-70 factor (ECF subfamily)